MQTIMSKIAMLTMLIKMTMWLVMVVVVVVMGVMVVESKFISLLWPIFG